ncbi:uncharacterized protein LOC143557172 [Bidens hawaiensis]|uniref:uncharacterized protein LOC143557172 n=1 Tax=Bidens hawaiensis TaxID=980011 RepID=UPI00404AA211
MASMMPNFGLRRLPSLNKFRSSLPPRSYSIAVSSATYEEASEPNTNTLSTDPHNNNNNKKKPKSSFFPKRGETLELVCESLAFKGKGLCKVEDTGYVVMCDRALPGERFVGRVTRKKNNYAEVTKVKTLSPHRDMVEAPCEYSSHCGGCRTQNLLYEAQVKAKEEQVRDLVVHVGKFSYKDPEFENVMKPIVPCDMQFHYRNKMEFSFGPKRWLPKEKLADKSEDANVFSLGLHAPGFFDKVLNVDKCFLQSEPANKVLAAVQECWRNQELGLSPYDCNSHTGFLKHLTIRSGSFFAKTTLTGPHTPRNPTRPANHATSNNDYTVMQAEILYKLVEDCAGLKGDGSEIVLDLFCGTGTIGLTLAKKVKHVYGYEVVPEAISDARRNAKLNGIHNATFIQGDLNKISENFGNEFQKPDIVISDPNRPGMHTNLIKYLLKLKAPRIVYVSCSPATCARDLDLLCHGSVEQKLQGCYKLRSIQPVDMFPHTPHIECGCLLELC